MATPDQMRRLKLIISLFCLFFLFLSLCFLWGSTGMIESVNKTQAIDIVFQAIHSKLQCSFSMLGFAFSMTLSLVNMATVKLPEQEIMNSLLNKNIGL